MSKITDQYPGKELSTDDLKKQLVEETNIKEASEAKFPTEIIDLPSKGLLYTKDNPLSSGQVEMKYMTAKEEDILTSQNLISKGVVIDMLLRSLIIGNGQGKRINYDDLVLGDKNAIMIAARVLGYGAEYPIDITCPKCGAKQKETINLADLENKVIDSYPENENRFEYELPLSKRKIEFRILSHRDEAAIADVVKRKKKQSRSSQVSFELTSRLKQMIISVDGNDDRREIESFVENEFISRDSHAFRKNLETVTPDVDMTYFFECQECGHEEQVSIPLTVEFFWPRV
tara:strand:- start:1146 stop:2009 length:864 start_codon:yes stop_codon:yes gene_type:complete